MKLIPYLLIITIFHSCTNTVSTNDKIQQSKKNLIIKTDNYELVKSNKTSKAVLILFGGFPQKPEHIKQEFKILDIATENNVDVLLMNYNKKLWLDEDEKLELAKLLKYIFLKNSLPTDNIYIGGMSSGGNVSLLISNFLIGIEYFLLKPKGVFIVDSPVDLLQLFRISEKNIARNFSAPSVSESKFLVQNLKEKLGDPNIGISKYEKHAPFTMETNNIENIKNLKDCKVRFYTEPDTIWWKKNRMNEYEEMNAYSIKLLAEAMQKEFGNNNVEYIPTENRGYRSNGMRHPHSWSIVDIKDLVDWITN